MTKRERVWEKSKGYCWYCGDALKQGWHVDHLEPQYGATCINKPVNNDLENLVPACPPCNLFKGAFSVEGFRREIELQKQRVRKYSSGFRIAERMGIIEVKESPVVFWFERERKGEG